MANVNTADQLVIAGPTEPLRKAMQLALEQGARRVVPLEVIGAFHSEVMRSVQEELDLAIGATEIGIAVTPIIANVTAQPISTPGEIRTDLAEQLCGCVLWRQSLEYMLSQGVGRFIEIGPGKVLAGLTRRIAPEAQVVTVESLDALAALTVS